MRKILSFLIAFCVCFFFYLNCALAQHHPGKRKVHRSEKKVIKYGMASFYAKKFGGRKSSDGSAYNSTKLTAACNSLPLGTMVKVTNLKNKKSVVVKITDHLHYKSKRLIDLSKYAAQQLGFISKGVARVKVEVIEKLKKKKSHLR